MALNYSAVFLAPQGGVTITCVSTCPSGGAGQCSGGSSVGDTLKFKGSMQMKVKMVGIGFQNCDEALFFDELKHLSIRESTFRYTNVPEFILLRVPCTSTQCTKQPLFTPSSSC